MGLTFLKLLLTIFVITFLESEATQSRSKPNSLVLPLTKDSATNLHVAYIRKRTPQVLVPLVVDLNGRFLWVNCERNYLSSTYNAPFCHSTQCSKAGTHYCHKCSSNIVKPGCHNNTCAVMVTNPITNKNAIGELAQDVVSIQSIQESKNSSSQWVTIPQFIFACAPPSLLNGTVPQIVEGIAGLGHTPVSLPTQIASYFGFQPEFSLCLDSSIKRKGGIFFGNIPSSIKPNSLTYTPLTISPQGEYFIPVRSIKINNKTVPFNTSLLSSKRGVGGAIISTTTPYSVLEHSLFKSFTQFFADQLVGVPKVEPISPFGLCFNSNISSPTTVGGIPNIDFVMQNRNISWTILGVDALVSARPNVSCLGIVDGGLNPRSSVIIGNYQLEDINFLHFDLSRSRMGFIPSRLSQPFNCSNFNFSTSDVINLELDTMGD